MLISKKNSKGWYMYKNFGFLEDPIIKLNNKELLTKWFETSPNGLAIKLLFKPNKYLTIIIHETGNLEYTTIWKEEDNATIRDI